MGQVDNQDKQKLKNSSNSDSNFGSARSNQASYFALGRGARGFGGQRGRPVVKPRDFKGTLKKLWGYFASEKKLLAVVSGFILVESGLSLIIPFLIGRSIDAMSFEGENVNFGMLETMVISLMVAYILSGLIHFFQGWIMAGVSQRIVLRLRRKLFAKLQKLPISFFDVNTHGEVMSRLSNDVDNISSTISQSTTHLISGGILIAGSFIMMLLLSPLLTLASLITIPLVYLITRTIAKRTRALFKEQQAVIGKLNGHIEEAISGVQIIKAFNHEDKVIEEFDEINLSLRKVGIKAQIWSGYMMPIMNVINNIGFAVVAGVGGILAVRNLITLGIIASFLSYSRQFARPLSDLANIFNTLQSAVAGAERVFEILDENEEDSDIKEAKVLDKPLGNVVFNNVTFGYRKDVPILKNVSFEVKEGSSIALVGQTGAGKTTIVNLLTRFYDVSDGKIMIDGTDIRNYTRDSLRKCFGVVLQDTYLFSGTIMENIKYGRTEASDEEAKAAAKMANADTFIKRLSKGYDTLLSESGSNLSQGQRQLIAIARAILADPSILILDEATSSVDTRTELHIQEGMLKLMKGRTSFIIAHRLSTIREADTIMVIQNGEIVENGSHEKLLAQEGIYYNLYHSQYKGIAT